MDREGATSLPASINPPLHFLSFSPLRLVESGSLPYGLFLITTLSDYGC